MKCKNCGGNYKTRELKCPYCNSENFIGRIWQTERTQAELDYLSEKEKTGKIILSSYMFDRLLSRAVLVVIILHVVSIAAIFLVAIGGYGFENLNFHIHREEIETQMEEYYSAGECEKLYVYMQENNVDFGKYHTYATAALMNYDYNEYMEYRLQYQTLSEEEKLEDDYYLEYALKNSSDVYSRDCGIRGKHDKKNEEMQKAYQKEIMAYWRGELKLTEEEIEALTKEDAYLYELYDEIEKIVQNLKDRRLES